MLPYQLLGWYSFPLDGGSILLTLCPMGMCHKTGMGMASGRMTSFGSSSSLLRPMLAKLMKDPSAFLRLSGRMSWISLKPPTITIDLLMKVTKTWKTGMLWEMLTIVVSMIPCLLFLVSFLRSSQGTHYE